MKNISQDSYISNLNYYDFIKNTKLIEPDNNFVISRNFDDEIVSLYGDNVWTFIPYQVHQNKKSIYFNKIDNSHIKDMKRLLFIIILYGKGRNNSQFAPKHLVESYYSSCLIKISKYSTKCKINLNTFFEAEKHLYSFFSENIENNLTVTTLFSILNILYKVNNEKSGINYIYNKKFINSIKSLASKYQKKYDQTEVIPTSIFSNSLKERWMQLEEIISNQNSILKVMTNIIENKKFGSGQDKWDEDIKDIELKKVFNKYNVYSRMSFSTFIKQIQGTCKHLILAYTGMRNIECLSLRVNCLNLYKNEQFGTITQLIGVTTKLDGYEKTEKWVTTDKIIKPVHLLESISKIIAKYRNIDIKDTPLLISTAFLSKKKSNLISYNFREKHELRIDDKLLLIKEEDIKELESIEVFRDWRNDEEFSIGKRWHIKAHQYRRSLAIYSIQSGLVSLGGLQIQMKHLFKEMTAYYSNGASLAKKLFDVSSIHIASDFNKLKPEVDALTYLKNVIFSEEELLGIHGEKFDKEVKQNKNLLKVFLDRKETIKRFKSGELYYKETALGGCVSGESCNNHLVRSITACVNCESGILTERKINNVISQQKEFLLFFNPDSIEYRTELNELEVLENFRKKIKKEVNVQK